MKTILVIVICIVCLNNSAYCEKWIMFHHVDYFNNNHNSINKIYSELADENFWNQTLGQKLKIDISFKIEAATLYANFAVSNDIKDSSDIHVDELGAIYIWLRMFGISDYMAISILQQHIIDETILLYSPGVSWKHLENYFSKNGFSKLLTPAPEWWYETQVRPSSDVWYYRSDKLVFVFQKNSEGRFNFLEKVGYENFDAEVGPKIVNIIETVYAEYIINKSIDSPEAYAPLEELIENAIESQLKIDWLSSSEISFWGH